MCRVNVLEVELIFTLCSVHGITLNLDIAPTLLDIAGVAVPDHMDGASVMKLLDTDSQGFVVCQFVTAFS